MKARRGTYRSQELRPLLQARSVAIIGASDRPTSFGARTLANLAAYEGRIHLVNPARDRIGDRPCFPTVAALPEVPEVAMLTVPLERVESAVLDCAAAGVRGVVVGASGYAETGREDRAAMQARLAALARDAGIRVIGPNCLGVVNFVTGQALTFATVPRVRPTTRSIGIVSQSGALGCSLAQAAERGVSISHMLTSGNSCDVDMADLIAYLADEPGCAAIACLFEGTSTPGRIVEAARLAWQAGKPVVVHKIATGSEGAAAALSHTGSLAGSEVAYRAAFEDAGVVMVDRFEALVEMAAFLAKAPPPTAAGAVVVATSGGAAIMAADAAEAHGVALPQPRAEVKAILDRHVPDFGSSRNPCDVTAQVATDPASLVACTDALLAQSDYGAMVVPHPYAYNEATPRFQALGEIGARHGKPVCMVWLAENLQGPGAHEAERNRDVALFRSMDRCFAALTAWQRLHGRRQRPAAPTARLSPPTAAAGAAALLTAASTAVLTEREAKAVLERYGIPVVAELFVTDAAAAAQAAQQIGRPVALKVESPAIAHKTEAGAIRLNLRGDKAVRQAFQEVMANALRVAAPTQINGVLVQPMIEPGIEILIGGRVDPLFGPLIVVGFGGVLVELLEDSVLALAPVSTQQALAMLDRLRGGRLLDGYRNLPGVDRHVLADIIARASELIADGRGRIAEIDINPLICRGRDIVAVDALIALKPEIRS